MTDYKNKRSSVSGDAGGSPDPLEGSVRTRSSHRRGRGRIEQYTASRLAAKRQGNRLVAPATVNRELAALCRASNLAVKQKRLSRAPVFEMLEEAPPREGFVEPNQFRHPGVALARLPP